MISKEALKRKPTIYQWECSGLTDPFDIWFRRALVLTSSWIGPIIILVFGNYHSNPSIIFTVIFIGTLITLLIRYIALPDIRYSYSLKDSGIYYTYESIMPKNAYKTVRVFGWLGIIICIVAFFYIGPLAFIGAGSCALISFKLIDFKSDKQSGYILLSSNMIIFNNSNSCKVELFPKDCKELILTNTLLNYYDELHTNSYQQKKELIFNLKSTLPQYEEFKINRWKDKDNHSIFRYVEQMWKTIHEQEEQAEKDKVSSKS